MLLSIIRLVLLIYRHIREVVMTGLQELLMRQHLLKKELKEINDQIKEIAEKDSAQMQLDIEIKKVNIKEVS